MRGMIEKAWFKVEVPQHVVETLIKAMEGNSKDEPPSGGFGLGSGVVLGIFLTLGGIRLLLDILGKM